MPETLQILQYEYVPDIAEKRAAAPRGAPRPDRRATTARTSSSWPARSAIRRTRGSCRLPLRRRRRGVRGRGSLRRGGAGREPARRALDRRRRDAWSGSPRCRWRSRATRSSGWRAASASRRCSGCAAAGWRASARTSCTTHDAFARSGADCRWPARGRWSRSATTWRRSISGEEPPEWGDIARDWRNWTFESAALDLALRQAGLPLHEALGLSRGR